MNSNSEFQLSAELGPDGRYGDLQSTGLPADLDKVRGIIEYLETCFYFPIRELDNVN